jgi:hypothetical protein
MKNSGIRKSIRMAVSIAIGLIMGLAIVTAVNQPAQAQTRGIVLSHYIFPEFTEGYIFLKGGPINKGSLNLNALTEEVVFMSKGKVLAIGENEIGRVDSVVIAGRRFVVFNKKFVEELWLSPASDGAHPAKSLCAEYKCSVIAPGKPGPYGTTSQTSSTVTMSTLVGGGAVYNLSLPEGYKTKPYINYWINKGSQSEKFSTINQLRKLYPHRADFMKKYLKEHKVKIEDIDAVRDFVVLLEE